MNEHEELPTGKKIIRQLDEEGQLRTESHIYGLLDIGMTRAYEHGSVAMETYFLKKRMVSRKRYEKAIEDFPDMPAPNVDLEDFGGELLKDVRKERRQKAKDAENHSPDPEIAKQIDEFCRSMLESGITEDAILWVKSPGNALGEYSNRESNKLVTKLLKVGAKTIFACEIELCDGDEGTSGQLVIELPTAVQPRTLVLQEVSRLAALQGFDRELDDGQQYSFIKLD